MGSRKSYFVGKIEKDKQTLRVAVGSKGGLGNSSPNYKQGTNSKPKETKIKEFGNFPLLNMKFSEKSKTKNSQNKKLS